MLITPLWRLVTCGNIGTVGARQSAVPVQVTCACCDNIPPSRELELGVEEGFPGQAHCTRDPVLVSRLITGSIPTYYWVLSSPRHPGT
jgi:hypothetical protein